MLFRSNCTVKISLSPFSRGVFSGLLFLLTNVIIDCIPNLNSDKCYSLEGIWGYIETKICWDNTSQYLNITLWFTYSNFHIYFIIQHSQITWDYSNEPSLTEERIGAQIIIARNVHIMHLCIIFFQESPRVDLTFALIQADRKTERISILMTEEGFLTQDVRVCLLRDGWLGMKKPHLHFSWRHPFICPVQSIKVLWGGKCHQYCIIHHD